MNEGRFRLALPRTGEDRISDEEWSVLERWANTLPFGFTMAPKTYTPTWRVGGTDITVGNGQCYGYYAKLGPITVIHIESVWGSTSSLNAGTGTMTWSLPYSTAFGSNVGMLPLASSAMVLDSGTNWYGYDVATDSTFTDRVRLFTTDGAAMATVTHASPMTPATNDVWSMGFAYFHTLRATDT